MKLGICTSIPHAAQMAQLGYDYIEPPLREIAALSPEAFADQRRMLADAGIACEVMNCMLPGDLKVTGPSADLSRLDDYLAAAFERAATLGAQVIVFGSGASRSAPEGFDRAVAEDQLLEALSIANRRADPCGLRVAVEPLCRAECNLVNTVAKAVALVTSASLPRIGVLGDTYHMALADESYDALADAGSLLLHVHIANPVGRRFPHPGDGQPYDALFHILRQSGYDARVSIESGTDALLSDADVACRLLAPLRR